MSVILQLVAIAATGVALFYFVTRTIENHSYTGDFQRRMRIPVTCSSLLAVWIMLLPPAAPSDASIFCLTMGAALLAGASYTIIRWGWGYRAMMARSWEHGRMYVLCAAVAIGAALLSFVRA